MDSAKLILPKATITVNFSGASAPYSATVTGADVSSIQTNSNSATFTATVGNTVTVTPASKTGYNLSQSSQTFVVSSEGNSIRFSYSVIKLTITLTSYDWDLIDYVKVKVVMEHIYDSTGESISFTVNYGNLLFIRPVPYHGCECTPERIEATIIKDTSFHFIAERVEKQINFDVTLEGYEHFDGWPDVIVKNADTGEEIEGISSLVNKLTYTWKTSTYYPVSLRYTVTVTYSGYESVTTTLVNEDDYDTITLKKTT